MDYLKRGLEQQILSDLQKKMVFLAGPRQCGKTSLACHLLKKETGSLLRYLNWDAPADRELILKEAFPAGPGMLVLDEIHKYTNWRRSIKGLYDMRKEELSILVTGSGKLEHYSHGGDSLQGRYFLHRMYPMSLDEFLQNNASIPTLEDFFHLGPFPEPLLGANETEARRWSRDYRQRLVEEEVRSLENVRDISKMALVVSRLPDLIGSPLSINALREDLSVAHKTLANWLDILETLFLHFRIYPFGAPKIRAVKKEAKLYLFDWISITDKGARFENLLAFHLLKQVHSLVDSLSEDLELRYFRDTDAREVDFIITESGKPVFAIEAKYQDTEAPKSLLYFQKKFPETNCLVLFYKKSREYTDRFGIEHRYAGTFLRENFLQKSNG